MANFSVYDIENYPGVQKTVTADLTSITSKDSQGDEQWVLKVTTSAYSSPAPAKTAIQPMFIHGTVAGWCKSSGLVSSPFNIGSGTKKLLVAIDELTPNSSFAEITLTEGTGLSGDAVALNMQEQINNLALTGHSKAGNLSYLNATVSFSNNVFKVVSGSCGSAYVGSHKSSVTIVDSVSASGCAAILGFDYPTSSESIASTAVKETSLTEATTSGTGTLHVANGAICSSSDCVVVFGPTTSGSLTPHKEYYKVTGISNVNDLAVTPNIASVFGIGAKVQVLREADPDITPASAYSDFDSLVRFGVRSVTAQIDFSN